MSSRLADRLNAVQEFYFVGREQELSLFHSIVKAEKLTSFILFVYGPGGIGKTTLLRRCEHFCSEEKINTLRLDGRSLDATPAAFIQALQLSLGILPPASPLDYLARQPGRSVFFIDTYENLAPLDDWLRLEFLPQLTDNVLVVIAGRNAPSLAWRMDPSWQSMTVMLPLRNLNQVESRSYLEKRSIPEAQREPVLEFTHGHPLALSLVADVFAQRGQLAFVPEDRPDVIEALLEQFVQKVPGPAHRTALEACALVRSTTEATLAAMLKIEDVRELFDWLRGLSFIELRRAGLFPHDLARDALVADLRWRNPDWYAEMKRRARLYYTNRIPQTTGQEQQEVLLDLVFLHRENSAVRPFFEWQSSGSTLVDRMNPSDTPILVDMVDRHEGGESARIAAHWFSRQPDEVLVLRDSKNAPTGFVTMVDIQRTTMDDDLQDPALPKIKEALVCRGSLRSGERGTIFRFWMANETYQQVSPLQSLLFIQMVRHYLTTPGLGFSFIPCADPGFWELIFAYADLDRIPEADFVCGGRAYGVYGHDWRAVPPAAWMALLAERENALGPVASTVRPPSTEHLVVLSQDEFGEAVREALRVIVHPDRLRHNPLLRSRLVLNDAQTDKGEKDRVFVLQELLKSTGAMLKASPKGEKLYRALDVTYYHPAPTQEAAAEVLDLPFSTYRRHLKSGVERITEILWQREIGST
jgi:hypothetical protein